MKALYIRLSAVYAVTPKVNFDVVIRGSLNKVLKLMKELGYEGIELNIPDPYHVDVNYLKKATKTQGVEVSAISTGLSYLTYGYSLSSEEKKLREKAIEFFKKYIDISTELCCKKVVIGLARGKCKNENCEKAKKNFMDSLDRLSPYAEKQGSILLLEPLNRYETNLINHLSEALEIIRNYKNVKLLFDTFHMMLEEGSVYEAINKAGSSIGHVHFADSNRLAPGMGMLDWERIIYRLVKTGYRGFASIEARAEPNFETLLRVSMKTLKPLLL